MTYEFKPMRQIIKLIGYCITLVFMFMVGDYINPNLDTLMKLMLGTLVVGFAIMIVASVVLYVFKPIKI